MSADCVNKSPLQRSGTSQFRRVLDALKPESAKVDEREEADLILFAKKYAAYLAFYNQQNLQDGNWEALMKMDVSVILATIAKQDAGLYYKYLNTLSAEIIRLYKEKPSGYEEEMKQQYKYIFDFVFSLIYKLDQYIDLLPVETGFKEFLQITVRSRMAELHLRLISYFDASRQFPDPILDETSIVLDSNAPIQVEPAQILTAQSLSRFWTTSITFVPPLHGTGTDKKIWNTINHNVFKGIIESFFKVYAVIVNSARKYLNETLDTFPTHSPHYALFLAFIKLFRYAQNDLNSFTDRHFKLYLKEILRLFPAAAAPDQTYLLFELQKNVESHLLQTGTVFKAGKDSIGRELFYALEEDLVVNKGALTSVRSLFRSMKGLGANTYFTLYCAPVSDSADGKGAELTGADKSWKPFGNPSVNETARIGFAVAHYLFYLQGGTRKITIQLKSDDLSGLNLISKAEFYASLSGEKGWQEANVINAVKESGAIKIEIEIDAAADAVVGYNEQLHNAQYNTNLPVLQILVKNSVNSFNYLKRLSATNIKEISIKVEVEELKDLKIQNSLGSLDPSKPFEIFGPQAHLGAEFIMGSSEVFLKNLQDTVYATLFLEWDNIGKLRQSEDYEYIENKTLSVHFLQNGEWIDSTDRPVIFSHNHVYIDGQLMHFKNKEQISLILPPFDHRVPDSVTNDYNINQKNGFMKLVFLGPKDFGHSDFTQRFTKESLRGASANLPDAPYTPSVKSIHLNYTATASINLQSANTPSEKSGFFFHVHPFGIALKELDTPVSILPSYENEGEMYLGIENFKANQALSVLFKVAEGSADPTLNRQEIQWHYLGNKNEWKPFDKGTVLDETNDLTRSGIIKFIFPSDATDQNTLMGDKFFWIKGAVSENSAAVCDIVKINTQAAKVVLTDYKGKDVGFTGILPANTISKLLITDSAVKKIIQPYESFNGKEKEKDENFYTRVSERLRHKSRSLTIWDYERMVLQEFPDIYKVKCIQHAKLNGSGTLNELAPGYVMIVPIPDLRGRSARDPFRPQTSIGRLNDIKLFLQKYISPFVRLDVKNPLFEEIRLDFQVKFKTDEGAFYQLVLQKDIDDFLSPWIADPTVEVDFGGKVNKSVLINFIEERPYVEYLTCIKMYHIVNGISSADIDEAVASSARSVFVSYTGGADPASIRHGIEFEIVDCNC